MHIWDSKRSKGNIFWQKQCINYKKNCLQISRSILFDNTKKHHEELFTDRDKTEECELHMFEIYLLILYVSVN